MIEIRRVFEANFCVYGMRKVWRQLARVGSGGSSRSGGPVRAERRAEAQQFGAGRVLGARAASAMAGGIAGSTSRNKVDENGIQASATIRKG